MQKLSCLFFALLYSAFVIAQDKQEKPKWDVANPPYPYTTYNFETEEGTWMNLDVSPDGKWIVFDLLGDIYKMPVTGGAATILRSGIPFEVQPRFSPDGSRISYTSDKGGGDNIWVMNADGSDPRQITEESFRLLNNAVWTPDGNYLVARKHFTSTRSLGAGELWMYHIAGGGGIQLNKRKNDQQDLGEPVVSLDGKYVYYSEDVYPGGYFQYNKDPNSQIYVIKRLELATGDQMVITGGSGGAVRPQLSSDGHYLSFVRRIHEKSVLFVRHLQSGEEWPVFDQLSKDQQEAWAIFGVYTNYAWLPDNRNVVIWAGGKIRKVDVFSKTVSEIPFSAKCAIQIADAIHNKQEAAPDSFTVKAVRSMAVSGDGKTVVFNAAGYLWKKNMSKGKPARLTSGSYFEYDPSFSADGNQLVYVTWSDTAKGAVCSMVYGKSTRSSILTKEKGIYRTPKLSPDSKLLVYVKEDGNSDQGSTWCNDPGIYLMDLNSGKSKRIADHGSSPSFNADGSRIYFFDEKGDSKKLCSMDLTGNEIRTHFSSKLATAFVPSPDNKWVAFTELFKIYLVPFPPGGLETDLSAGTQSIPLSGITRDEGISLVWAADSKSVHYTKGGQIYTVALNTRFNFLQGAPDTILPPDSSGIALGLELPSDKPEGVLALRGARIITMNNSREVIENGTIIIDRNRITAIGKSESINIPGNAKVIDVKGKTIMPGIVDVHAHLGAFRNGLSPQQQWSYFANLTYGVTTTHDPSANSSYVFSQSEMVKAGFMTGPRIFSTGWILYGAEGDFKSVINSLDDARSAVRRTKDWGAFSVKSYNQPRREQRQQVIAAARELNMEVVPEGGSFFYHNLSMIMDGHTGIEHNLPVAPLYDDVLKFWSHANTGYTPTLIVCYGAMNGENYFYQHDSVWTNKKLLNFTPRFVVDSRSRHVTAVPEGEYENGHILVSKSCKALMDQGVKVNLGSHGQLQGLGAHWELWMLSQGGMSNMEALQCATINGAHYIGMDDEIGSLEKGKLADLVVLSANPLEDIHNSQTVEMTMVNGRLYDAATLNEIGNYRKNRLPFYFEGNEKYAPFDWHEAGHGDGD